MADNDMSRVKPGEISSVYRNVDLARSFSISAKSSCCSSLLVVEVLILIGWAMMRRVDDDVKDDGRLLYFLCLCGVMNDMMGTKCCKTFINRASVVSVLLLLLFTYQQLSTEGVVHNF